MKSLKPFDIEIFRLSNGKHDYVYELDDTFFALTEGSFLEKGKLTAKVTLEKSERLLVAEFDIKGSVELICDRSLEPYEFEVDTTNKLIFKYGEEFAELSEDVISIPRDIQKLNLAQYIYEFIGLTVPMKKLHPRFKEEEDEEEGDKLIYKSEPEKDKDSDEPIDPRWNALKNLKNKLK